MCLRVGVNAGEVIGMAYMLRAGHGTPHEMKMLSDLYSEILPKVQESGCFDESFITKFLTLGRELPAGMPALRDHPVPRLPARI
jgi:hypothetical protein